MANLAYLHYYGFGVEESDEEAFRLWKVAAEAGESNALENLGFCYEDGVGVEKNLEEAEKWYERAREERRKRAKADPRRTPDQIAAEEALSNLRRILRKSWD